MRLKELRAEKGVQQKDLADYLKIANSTYSQYETGKRVPSIDMLMKIADFFGVSVDYLLGRSDYPQYMFKWIGADGKEYIVTKSIDEPPTAEDKKRIEADAKMIDTKGKSMPYSEVMENPDIPENIKEYIDTAPARILKEK